MFRDFPTFSRTCIFFLLTLSLLWSSLFCSSLLYSSALPLLSSVHIVGSLTSKLPSVMNLVVLWDRGCQLAILYTNLCRWEPQLGGFNITWNCLVALTAGTNGSLMPLRKGSASLSLFCLHLSETCPPYDKCKKNASFAMVTWCFPWRRLESTTSSWRSASGKRPRNASPVKPSRKTCEFIMAFLGWLLSAESSTSCPTCQGFLLPNARRQANKTEAWKFVWEMNMKNSVVS